MKNIASHFKEIDIQGLDDYILCETLDLVAEECANATPANTTAKNTMGMGNPKMPTEDGEVGTEPLATSKPKAKSKKHKKRFKEEEE